MVLSRLNSTLTFFRFFVCSFLGTGILESVHSLMLMCLRVLDTGWSLPVMCKGVP